MVLSEHQVSSPARLLRKFHVDGTIAHLGFSLSWQAFEDPLKECETYGWGPEIHSKLRRLLLLLSETEHRNGWIPFHFGKFGFSLVFKQQ